MAWKEVTVEKSEVGGEFVKLAAIGDKLLGAYVSSSPSTGTYAKPGDLVFRILTGGGKLVAFDPPYDAARKLKKALSAGDLKRGCMVEVKYTSNLDTGKEKPMGVYQVRVDPEVNPKALAAIAKLNTAPAAPKAEDDIPF